MSERLALYGTEEPPASGRRLRAGALEADLVSGNLRTIRFAGREVIRAVAYVVRDRDWGTYDLGVESPVVQEDGSGFTVTWAATCIASDGTRLAIAATIRGEASGHLAFEVTAVPDGDFETNRCGFCILHPIEGVAGRPVAVTHSDGTVEYSVFPDLIEPWQPFKDIAAIRHEAAPGLAVTCRMDGDTFEMEDQRAWSDASYKTYVRPLARPWPYRLPAGEANRQRIVVEIAGETAADPVRREAEPVRLSLGPATGERFPDFGLLVSPEDAAEILAAPGRLPGLNPRHLLFHFDPTAGHGAAELRALAAVQALLPETHAMLECVVPCERDLDAELAEAARLVREARLRLDAVTVGPAADRQSTPPGSEWPPCLPLEQVYAAARRAFANVRLGGGMFSYFTELNRKRPPMDRVDYVTHATCPLVHAADDLSVMQTLEAVPFITHSTRAIAGEGKPYHLGPTTIGMRQNPYGSRTMSNPEGRRVAMAADDPRGRGLFAAAWLVGYAARLPGANVERWTGGSLAGPRGLVRGGDVVPAFHAAKALAALSGLPLRPLRSSIPSEVDGIAAVTADGRLLLRFANLTPEPLAVVPPSGIGFDLVAILDAAAPGPRPLAVPAGEPLALGAYAVAFAEASASSAD
ncbi:D-apionate lactonase [Aureimonas leprariae]|uniref:Uncharacterized protein n=1 Tax=Plantimonas leprariae TaxID=2615207 RepID=A0A7V7PL51_9HYPH|nr:hypothetical protein [Aureimonas leprariae]KAB0676882.1 hypothetical protein F6X38_20135 [Aureimonas leprariae]